jgi:hypothetical protein
VTDVRDAEARATYAALTEFASLVGRLGIDRAAASVGTLHSTAVRWTIFSEFPSREGVSMEKARSKMVVSRPARLTRDALSS